LLLDKVKRTMMAVGITSWFGASLMCAEDTERPLAPADSAMTISESLGLLFDAELQARSDMPPAVATEGREGKLVGNGDGTVRGPRIRGKLRWSNFEKVGESVCEMNLTGVIDTEDGARIDFDSRGYALLANPPKWDTAGAMRFATTDKRYEWLNGALANWQGNFDPATLRANLRAFTTAEGSKIEVKADRISLFDVPLRCEAAPEIGCGSRSKPILLELERDPIVAEAWLNGTGTVLAVVWTEASSRELRTKAIQSVLEKNGTMVRELDGEARETGLKSFVSGTAWYRGAEVDNLSKQEARTIAARLVR
jgi:hypothetical protein